MKNKIIVIFSFVLFTLTTIAHADGSATEVSPKEPFFAWKQIKYRYTSSKTDSFGFNVFKVIFDEKITRDKITNFTECPMINNYCVRGKEYSGQVRVVGPSRLEIMYPQGKATWREVVIEKLPDGSYTWGAETLIFSITTE